MADNKSNAAKAIPVELLLSSIGQQVKVDIEAHRQRLLADIGDREQRLAELRRRRQELVDRETIRAEEPLPVGEPAGGRLFDSAAPLADDEGDEQDWLADEPGGGLFDSAAPLADDSGEDWLAGSLPDDQPEESAGFAGGPDLAPSAAPLADDSGEDWRPGDRPVSAPSAAPVTPSGPAEPASLADLANEASALLGEGEWNF